MVDGHRGQKFNLVVCDNFISDKDYWILNDPNCSDVNL